LHCNITEFMLRRNIEDRIFRKTVLEAKTTIKK
jgi:hypothetical protein